MDIGDYSSVKTAAVNVTRGGANAMRFVRWVAWAAIVGFSCVRFAGAEPVPVPRIEADELVTGDGTELPLTGWKGENLRAIVVALHGMGDYGGAFAMAGPEWASRGIATYAPDQRGFGRAPMRGYRAGNDALRRDLCDLLAGVRAQYPGVPVFALGESMGGAVVLSALANASLPVDGVILVAPAVWSRADMPWAYRASLWLVAHVAPSLTLTGRGLDIWPSDNIEMLRAYSRDPLVIKQTRADAIWGLVNLMDEARAAPERLGPTPPILFLYGAHDQIVPAAATEATAKALGARADVRKFPDGYHMLMRDKHGDIVRNAVADWVLDNLP